MLKVKPLNKSQFVSSSLGLLGGATKWTAVVLVQARITYVSSLSMALKSTKPSCLIEL